MSEIFGVGSEELDWTADLGEYDGERNELGERHGMGRAVLPNGDIYEGKYVHGQRHGRGVYMFRNGAKYEGFYDQGKKSGSGVFHYPDGSRYEVPKSLMRKKSKEDEQTLAELNSAHRHLQAKCWWDNDERNGKGTYRYANSDVYEGEWKDNKRHGKGIYQCSGTKLKYDGNWQNGKLNGPGSMILPSHVFLGSFIENVPYGPGRYVFDFGVEQHGEYTIKERKDTIEEEQIVWRCRPELQPLGS